MLDAQSAAATPPVIRREDYRKPDWLMPDVHLEFRLDPARTQVTGRLEVTRNGAHGRPLRLNGDGLAPLAVLIDGEPQADAWRMDGPDLLIDAKNGMPTVSLSLVEELSHVLVAAMERGELDAAFAYGVDEPRPGIERTALFEEELVLIRPVGDEPLPETVTLAEALSHDLVQAGERDSVQRLLKAAAEKFSLPLQILYEAQSVPAMRALVVRGAAASIMPYGTAIEELRTGKLAMQRISDMPPKRTLYLIRPSSAPALREQPAVDRFLASLVEHLLESLGTLARRVGS